MGTKPRLRASAHGDPDILGSERGDALTFLVVDLIAALKPHGVRMVHINAETMRATIELDDGRELELSIAG